MPTESYIALTKDNRVIVFDIEYNSPTERLRKINECRTSCMNRSYNEFMDDRNAHLHDHIPAFDAVDVPNTELILHEFKGYNYAKRRAEYRNTTQNNNYPPSAVGPNVIHFDNGISDDMVPEVIKNIGFKIEPVDRVYNVTYNPLSREFEFHDVETNEGFGTTVARVNHGRSSLEVIRNHFIFEPADAARLNVLVSEFERQKAADTHFTMSRFIGTLRDRDFALMSAYDKGYGPTQEKETTILHELKHVKNDIFYSGLALKKDAKRMSVEDVYRIKLEDERSAYFDEWIHTINKYLQGGNFSDYSMFDSGENRLVNKLRGMSTDAEKLAYLMDFHSVMRDFAKYFEDTKRDDYDHNQFGKNVESAVETLPMSAEPDTDRSYYRALRSLYFRYEVYNPQTHRMEFKDLSSYLPDEQNFPAYVQDNIIEPNKQKLETRRQRYNDRINGGQVDLGLLEEAKRVMRNGIAGASYINQVDDVQIATLYDDTPENPGGGDHNPPHNPEGNNPPHTPGDHNPPHTPDDHAEWSDDLKAYWSRVAGYRELAKNNSEYRFKINEATICYENRKRIQVSNNAPYDLYIKLLHEPSNANKPINFLSSLSREQALTLYVACINSGRAMRGNVPTDLSGIENLPGIPPEALNQFRHRTAHNSSSNERTTEPVTQRRIQHVQVQTMLRGRGGIDGR